MKLTFRTIKGSTFNIEAEPSTTVGQLKSAVEASQGSGFPKDQLKLVYKGKVLEDEAKGISEYSVDESGFLVVFVQKAAPKPAVAADSAGASASAATSAPAAEPAAAEPQAMQVDAPAAPVATPAAEAAPAAAAPAPAEPADPYSAAASHLLAGSALEQAVSSICEMGFPREDVMRAMRAAYNNPERAVEYLMTGIPEHAMQRAAGPAPGAAAVAAGGGGGAAAGDAAAPAAGTAAAAAGGAAGPPAPQAFDMFGGGGAAAGGAEPGAGGPLEFLRNNPQFQLLRRAVQANPDILAPMLQELRKQNPQLMQQISQHQQDFMRMVMEPPAEEEEDEMAQMAQLLGAMGGGAGGAGGLPPGVVQIELSEADDQAIQRLQGLGFERDECIQAYLACDKNEEVAANFLLEGGFGAD